MADLAKITQFLAPINYSISDGIGVGLIIDNNKTQVSDLIKLTNYRRTKIFAIGPRYQFDNSILLDKVVVINSPSNESEHAKYQKLLQCLERFNLAILLRGKASPVSSDWVKVIAGTDIAQAAYIGENPVTAPVLVLKHDGVVKALANNNLLDLNWQPLPLQGLFAAADCRPLGGPEGDVARLPEISYVIPCRNFKRWPSIKTVIDNVRAQHFPVIKIIISEHDDVQHIDPTKLMPSLHVMNWCKVGRPFNKSRAFNAGMAKVTTKDVVLHDADMLLDNHYTSTIAEVLQFRQACHLCRSVVYLDNQSTDYVNKHGLVTDDLNCESTITHFVGGSLACQTATYWEIGGFHEGFKGYGVEDVEFYDRLEKCTNFVRIRIFNLMHLAHDRSGTWHSEHGRNKQIGRDLMAKPISNRLASLQEYQKKWGHRS